MKKVICSILLIVSLTGCTSAKERLEEGLPRFVGKDINYAIKYLGYPDGELNIAGKKIFVWKDSVNHTSSITTYRPQYTTTMTPFGGMTSYTNVAETTPLNFSGTCEIKLITNGKKVLDTEFSGNGVGCSRYGRNVQKLIDDTTPEKQDKQ